MTESQTELSPKQQVESASKAFEQEFERFARFTGDPAALAGLDLEAAVAEERALAELRTRHLGKKSALAATKKLIGRVGPEERAAFGQLVQSTEAALVQAFEQAELSLKNYIDNERIGGKGVLWKNTLALQFQQRPGYLERPVLRLFATYGDWSDDLKGAIATNSEFMNRTSGFIFGLQVEAAW